MFVSAKYSRVTKPDDAMYFWLENLDSKSFELCIREFLPFDGKHEDTIVVSGRILTFSSVLTNYDSFTNLSNKEHSTETVRAEARWSYHSES